MSKDSERRSRLRWVTLGEAVAIAAVAISGLGLYTQWQDRREERAEKAATVYAPLTLRASPNGDGSVLTLTAADPDDAVQSQSVRFPPAFGLPPASSAGDPRIEAGWFADALKAERKRRKLSDETVGDARMPVMLATTYLSHGQPRTARAFYDVGYALEGRFLRGSAIKLRGLSLIGAAPHADAAADQRLAALWAARAGAARE